ncbi:hypothetical protein D3C85_1534430 [compost metagenome]
MDQATEMLLVVVLEVGVVVLQHQVRGDLPVAAGKAELVAFFGCPGHRQACVVARSPARDVFDLPRHHREVVDFL